MFDKTTPLNVKSNMMRPELSMFVPTAFCMQTSARCICSQTPASSPWTVERRVKRGIRPKAADPGLSSPSTDSAHK
jgi:hypothetical protein